MTTGSIYGSSVGGLGGTLAAENVRFGTLGCVRQFVSGMPGALASGLTTSQVMFYSFKCKATDYTGMAAGTYDAAITTWARGLATGQPVYAIYYHEPENDGFTFAQVRASQDHFNNLIHTMTGVTANLKTCQVLMASTVLGWNNRNIANYWPTTHLPDHIGFDFDGPIVNVGSNAYPNMSTWVTTAQTFAASKGIPWSVTEFAGSPLNPADTPGHALRAAWNTSSAAQFSAGGAQYVMYWDDGDGYLSQTVEINAWKALVGAAPPTTPAAPTGITCTPASNGLTATIGWSVIPGGVDHLDAYLQGPGQTYPHKLNTTGPVAVTPRTYVFPTVPGTTYAGATLVAAADSAGTNRSGYGTLAPFTAPNPGSGGPTITSAVPTQDATTAQLFHLAASATGTATLTYLWTFTYPSDPTVSPVTLAVASGDVTLPQYGGWLWSFKVTDGAALSTTQTGAVTIAQTNSAFTPYLSLQMLQPNEDLRDMGPIERLSKPLIDTAIQGLAFRRSATNNRHDLVASNYDPGSQDNSSLVTPVAQDFYYTTLSLEGDTIAHLQTVTARAQTGTGAFGGLFTAAGALYNGFDPFSIDAWLQQTLGVVAMDLPAPLNRLTPGTVFMFGMWWPAAGVTVFPQFRARASSGVQASVGAIGAPNWGKIPTLAAFPTSIAFGSAVTVQEPFIGVPVP